LVEGIFGVGLLLLVPVVVPLVVDRLRLLLDREVLERAQFDGSFGAMLEDGEDPAKGELVNAVGIVPVLQFNGHIIPLILGIGLDERFLHYLIVEP
jgi:hypothetical protein